MQNEPLTLFATVFVAALGVILGQALLKWCCNTLRPKGVQSAVAQAEFLRKVIDYLPTTCCLVDSQNCFQYANDGFTQLFKSDSSTIAGRHLREVIPGAMWAQLLDVIDEARHRNRATATLVSEQLTSRKLEVTAQSLSDHVILTFSEQAAESVSAEILDTLTVQRYLSEVELAKQRIEQQARELALKSVELSKARDEALHATRAKSQFLANMSHEIRTPMNGIVGVVQLMREENLSSQQRAYLEIVEDAANDLITVINDILDSAKIEAGKLQLAPQPLDIRKLVQSISGLLEPQMQKRQLHFVVDIDERLPKIIDADGPRLRQVLTNLLGNAMKFTPADGCVVLGIHVLKQDDNRAQILFFVTDSGIGIPEDKQKALFAPFSQADATIARDYGGTGLGLFISRRLLELMGAEITLRSREGAGSVFYFAPSFELSQVVQTKASIVATAASTESLRVLLAEDNPINRRLAETILRKLGHECVVACDGIEAVEKARTEKFDVILMDCSMPRMSGFDATREIRANEMDGQRVPIIALTAHVLEEERERCMLAGMDDFITKPFERSVLQAKLLHHGRQVS